MSLTPATGHGLLDQDPDEIGASIVRHRPPALKQLSNTSGFSEDQLKILYRGFKQVSFVNFETSIEKVERLCKHIL